MKKLFALFLFALSFAAHALNTPSHTHHVYYAFPAIAQDVTSTEVDVTWDTPVNKEWGTFAMFWNRFKSGSGAYIGLLDDNLTGKKVIFSAWDASDIAQVMPYPLSHCQRFSHEGNGASCILKYEWQQGKTYKLKMAQLPDEPGDLMTARWGAWIIDSEGRETQIGAHIFRDVPSTLTGNAFFPGKPGLKGFGPIDANTAQTNVEIYTAPVGGTCAQIPATSVTWSAPKHNGSVRAVGATVNYMTLVGEPCGDYAAAYAKNALSVTQTVNANAPHRTPAWSNIWANYTANTVSNPNNLLEMPVAGYLDKVVCAFKAIEKAYPQYFKGVRYTESRGDFWYVINYPEDVAAANGLVVRMFYHHADRNLVVRFPGGQDLNLGTMDYWISAAGC